MVDEEGTVMPREAKLFEEAKGSVVEGYLLLSEGAGNIPPNWVDRARDSRRGLHNRLAEVLRKDRLRGLQTLRDWEQRYNKECFYRGIRALLELKRAGKTKI